MFVKMKQLLARENTYCNAIKCNKFDQYLASKRKTNCALTIVHFKRILFPCKDVNSGQANITNKHHEQTAAHNQRTKRKKPKPKTNDKKTYAMP